MSDVHDRERLARVAWSGIAEPGDAVAGALVGALGAADALDWLRDATARLDGGGAVEQGRLDRGGAADRDGSAAPGRDGEPGRRHPLDDPRLGRAVRRWAPRLARSEPAAALAAVERLGGGVLVPGDRAWPAGIDDLGPEAPACLWVRGRLDLGAVPHGAAAVVGARAATTYGERVAFDLAAGLATRGVAVVSGGAYGIDAAAHRGTLTMAGHAVVVLAGGVDRAYPTAHARLFEAVLDGGGAVVSELPPGGLPTRSRFLQRNRLIAAMAGATVVVEAAWRSGALSTAHHAARLLRPVGAVPGPVTSMASAGCHRLLRDGVAVCVTDAGEVLELVRPAGGAPEPERPQDVRLHDGLDHVARAVHEALPRRTGHDVTRIAVTAGVTADEALGALGLLELRGLAARTGDGWRVRPGSVV
ncbi:DNA-processing protein DprA [Cellulomonas alba]|uniref:DNA-processing protein DprA n=1 Tax=Cellulomonas alba TaxID=3053467 RepID=A0ABT7SKM1_9CELL|nr:DNA-processing protein DprA [Cellulomonas alba]MDM7856079.1 DNA-processing protein DprA [Cellulomonas alba]